MDGLTPVEQRAPGRWQVATVTSIKAQTPTVKSFRLEPADVDAAPARPALRRPADRARRLQAQRSYSIASSPLDAGEIELTIDCLADGEVSPYFHDVVQVGDEIEVRGPFASYFVWRGASPAGRY